MINYLRFEHFWAFFLLLPFLIFASLWRLKFYKPVIFRFTQVETLKLNLINATYFYKKFFYFLRLSILALLIFLIAKPQLADVRSNINVDGIDIVLAIDVSGSMMCFDDMNDKRSRIDVARSQAIRFINKRTNDAIGIVIFGPFALSKCPLTLDKKMLDDILQNLKIGEIDYNGTALAIALSTACNRLKNSKARSKVIILLTDGEPTPPDIAPEVAIEIAKKLGIKIYTIGIGNENGGFVEHPMFGVIPYGAKLNKELLEKIAQETNGKFFCAKNPKDLKNIYDEIDKLERTKYETNIFNKYYDFFMPFVFLIIFLLFIEQFLTAFVWFGL